MRLQGRPMLGKLWIRHICFGWPSISLLPFSYLLAFVFFPAHLSHAQSSSQSWPPQHTLSWLPSFLSPLSPLFIFLPSSHSLSQMISLKVLRASSILFHTFSCPLFYILKALMIFQYFLQPTPYWKIPPKLGSVETLGYYQYIFSKTTTDQCLAFFMSCSFLV